MSINWLHLSDFHVGQDGYGQKQLFKELLSHVREQKSKGVVPDYVFITGDLAHYGLQAEYEVFNESFLDPLQKLIGNNIIERTFSVPGNHDVNRRKAPGFSQDKFLNTQNQYFDPTAEGLGARSTILERFAAFSANDQTPMLGEWINSAEGAYHFIDVTRSLGIVGINTAWLCEGDKDEKHLSPGKPLVENALENIKDCSIKIVLGHHPLDWFATEHRRQIEALFGKNNVIYLHGHLHESWVAPQYGSGQPFLSIQSGAAFQAREHPIYKNGLLWASIDLKDDIIKLQPRSWNTNNQDWSISEAFPENNRNGDIWEFALPGKKKLQNPVKKDKPAPTLAGWAIKDVEVLNQYYKLLDSEIAVKYFDGAIPDWQIALSSSIPRRRIVSKLSAYFSDINQRYTPLVIALIGAGCEGKSTAILQAAYEIIKGNENWRILRRGVETNPVVPEEIIPLLSDDKYWLIILDDAENSVDGIANLIKRLPSQLKNKVHFLLASRDSDWDSKYNQSFSRIDCSFSKERLSGLIEEDAQQIVRCWSQYGDEGLGELRCINLEQRANELITASKRDEFAQGSAFFGALLKVRYGDDLNSHAKKMLERLAKRVLPTGGTLQDALIYIASMDAIGMHFLSRSVLAFALDCPENQLRKFILQPLGEEAAATSTSDYVFTRHPLIAKTIMSVVVDEYGEDDEAIYTKLVSSALDLRESEFVPELGSWRYKIADYFFDNGRKNLAVKIVNVLRSREPNDARAFTKIAHLYRRAQQPETALSLYYEKIDYLTVGLDRRLYDDWSITERANNNYANAAVLNLFALSDQALDTPYPFDKIEDTFMQMCYVNRGLHRLSREPVFRRLVIYSAKFGMDATKDAEQLEEFDRHIQEMGARIIDYDFSVDKFIQCTTDALDEMHEYVQSGKVRDFLQKYGELTFSKFKKSLNTFSKYPIA
jgi:calcineurin-like phosphoesterase family protein